jgi:1-acyl-sn-glycerol-3-phosphate acyltransferase
MPQPPQPEGQPVKLSTWLASHLVRNPLIYAATLLLGIGSLASSLFDRSGRLQHGFARLWSRFILLAASTPLTVEGLENVDLSQPAIYAANHSSALDIPALYAGLPFQFRILAKIELFRLPILGWHLRRSGQIAIDRTDARASLRSLSAAAQTIRDGMSLVVFPEGGRCTDGHIQPFLGGTFYAAIKAQAPIVPMVIVGAFEALRMNTYVIHPGPFRLIVGQPIPTAGLVSRDMEALSNRVREAMRELYYANSGRTRPIETVKQETVAPTEALERR